MPQPDWLDLNCTSAAVERVNYIIWLRLQRNCCHGSQQDFVVLQDCDSEKKSTKSSISSSVKFSHNLLLFPSLFHLNWMKRCKFQTSENLIWFARICFIDSYHRTIKNFEDSQSHVFFQRQNMTRYLVNKASGFPSNEKFTKLIAEE